jgi:hypothetical protein
MPRFQKRPLASPSPVFVMQPAIRYRSTTHSDFQKRLRLRAAPSVRLATRMFRVLRWRFSAATLMRRKLMRRAINFLSIGRCRFLSLRSLRGLLPLAKFLTAIR